MGSRKNREVVIMFLAKRLIDNIPVVIYEHYGSATEQILLNPGLYEFVTIGGGGGGVILTGRSSTAVSRHWANGGVGGTVRVQVFVHRPTTITITISGGAQGYTGSFSASGTTLQGNQGGNTSITGVDNLSLISRGGTGAVITSTSSVGANRTPGIIGTNTVTGSAIRKVIANNAINIVSGNGVVNASGSQSQPSMPVVYANNVNWPENTLCGRGGSIGFPGGIAYNFPGNHGYVRITKL